VDTLAVSDARHNFKEYVNPHLGDLLEKVGLDKVYVKGEGAYLTDDEGFEYLDFLSNYGAVPLGHNYRPLKQALVEHVENNVPGFSQPSIGIHAATLAKKLVTLAPDNCSKAVFTNSGAESIEFCIKAARAATSRERILSAKNSFHGKTISALSATGQALYQEPYQLPVANFDYVPFGNIAALEEYFVLHGHELAALILEPIQGEGGVVVASEAYFHRAELLCRKYGVMFILDEVQTGIGRAGQFYYSKYLGLTPNAIALAKGLGGGLVPIGAVVLDETMYTESVAMTHSSTFAGGGVACAVANATVDCVTENNHAIIEQARKTGEYLKAKLNVIAEQFPGVITQVRGDGLMLGIEFGVESEFFKSDSGTLLGMLGYSGKLLPIISGYLANEHRIRVAPTLNSASTLRVQPPLNISKQHCDVFCLAIEQACALIAAGDTFSIVRHLLTVESKNVDINNTHDKYKFTHSPEPGDGRFGFLIHPLSLTSFEHFDASMMGVQSTDLRSMVESFEGQIKPTVVGTTRISSKNGKHIYGEFVAVPYMPEQLTTMASEDAVAVVKEAVLLLKQRGAKIVGLGGYTSIVTKAGMRMANLDVAVTTGNNYTVLSAIQAVDKACEQFSVNSGALHYSVIGAGGSIGSTITREIALVAETITLIGNGNNVDKTRRRFKEVLVDLVKVLKSNSTFASQVKQNSVAERILAHFSPIERASDADVDAFAQRVVERRNPEFGVEWGTDTETLLASADVVFVSTNTTEILVQPDFLKRSAIVCDLSRPSNVSQSISLHRPDVLMIDGGVIQTPNMEDLGVNFGFPKGLCFACMAETMMLAFDKRYQNTSLGAKLKSEDQAYFKRKADEFGFSIAGFRSFDLPLTQESMTRIKVAREAGVIDRVLRDDFTAYRNINQLLVGQHVYPDVDSEQSRIAIHGPASVTYAELAQRIGCFAEIYRRLGVASSKRVAILSDEGVDSICAILACFQLGAVAVVVNPHYNQIEVSTILLDAKISLMVTAKVIAPMHGIEMLTMDALAEQADSVTPLASMADVSEDAPAVIFCTSGSTGSPKKVVHTHGSIFNTYKNYGRGVLGLTEKDRLLSTSKCFFVYGFNCIHLALACGGGLILAPTKPTHQSIETLCREFTPSHVFSVPTIYLRLLQNDIAPQSFASVKYFISAGEPLPRDIFERWLSRFDKKILDGIGTTESMCFVISNYPEDCKPGSTGKPVPGYQIKLINEYGDEVKTGELGILWIKGDSVISQYADVDPDIYAEYFVEGWYKTNDVFYRDDIGWYYFQGRANDMVKVGGEWLSPYLLEETLNRHPEVSCSAVTLSQEVGLLNRPIAYVVPASEAIDAEELVRDLKEYSKTKLTRNQYPHIIEIINDLPKTHTGKLKRYMLKINENQRDKYLRATTEKLLASV